MTRPTPTPPRHAPQPEALVLSQASARARGCAHGEHWRDAIGVLSELRLAQVVRGRPPGVYALEQDADACLAVMAAQVPKLHEELLGIAQGANLAPRSILILNAAEDLHGDVRRNDAAAVVPSGGTSIYFNATEGAQLGQTWDFPAEVAPFVRVLRLRGPDGGPLWVLTMTGVLGLAGMGAHGLAVTGLGLHLRDRGPGLPWPAVVRRLLDCATARRSHEVLQRLTRAGSHYIIMADGHDFLGAETSHQRALLVHTGAKAAHLHTNHCFDPVMRQCESVPRASTSIPRINLASTIYAQQRPKTVHALWALLHTHDGGHGALCFHGDPAHPERPVTAAVAIMQLGSRAVRWSYGCERRGPVRTESLAMDSVAHR